SFPTRRSSDLQFSSFGPSFKAAMQCSVPKLVSLLPKRHAKTLQTPPTAQLTLIEADANTLTGVFWQYSWQSHAVEAFLPFLQGVPARNTELHGTYPGWLVGKTQVFICPSHDHMLSKLI